MTIDIKAPTFPESISEGTIARWLQGPGDRVARDALLVEIETDKVVLEVVAPTDGSLTAILVPEGSTVLSEQRIAVFEPGDVGESKLVEEVPASGDDAPSASPAARKLADESGIDIRAVAGSGRDGRITKDDIQRAVASSHARDEPTHALTALPTAAAEERVERRVPMTRLRASIARRLHHARQRISRP
ncbi:MAG: E3 binding domain-containing protein, partial [Pseudomonadales bacterium]